MTGKTIDRETAGFLVLIIPVAAAIVLIFTAWPLIILFFLLTLVWKVWQDHRWSKWSTRINPYFNQLLQEHQGCLTPMDLSVKANLTAKSAKQFLERKASEFGAQKKAIGEKGTVYYFITASTLGSIFDESELPPDTEAEITIPTTTVQAIAPTSQPIVTSPPLTDLGNVLLDKVEEEKISQPEEIAVIEQPLTTSKHSIPSITLQDLAKRLEVTPAVLGKRKNNEDFATWSRGKDREGIAWKYVPKALHFIPVDE